MITLTGTDTVSPTRPAILPNETDGNEIACTEPFAKVRPGKASPSASPNSVKPGVAKSQDKEAVPDRRMTKRTLNKVPAIVAGFKSYHDKRNCEAEALSALPVPEKKPQLVSKFAVVTAVCTSTNEDKQRRRVES